MQLTKLLTAATVALGTALVATSAAHARTGSSDPIPGFAPTTTSPTTTGAAAPSPPAALATDPPANLERPPDRRPASMFEPPPAEVEAGPDTRTLDVHASSELAGYAATDHVFVVSPTIAGTVTNPLAGWSVNGRYLVDVVSAASVDIVSTASRRYTEVRHVATIDGNYSSNSLGFSGGANISREPDYLSLSAHGAVTKELLDKNLTLLLAYNYTHDTAGRTGTSFSTFSRRLSINGFKGGATILIDRASILSIVGDVIVENGDPSKPYRYVPMFAPGTAVPLGASIDTVNQLRLSARVLEQLPLTRDRVALSARYAHRFSESTIRLDERAYVDTWGLKASSTDARWIFDVGSRFDIGPHVRVHAQSAVDFWQRAYTMTPGLNFPAIRTGDRELGPLFNLTGGGAVHCGIGPDNRPRSWVLGFELGVTSTSYLDDIYIKQRLATIGAISLEADL